MRSDRDALCSDRRAGDLIAPWRLLPACTDAAIQIRDCRYTGKPATMVSEWELGSHSRIPRDVSFSTADIQRRLDGLHVTKTSHEMSL